MLYRDASFSVADKNSISEAAYKVKSASAVESQQGHIRCGWIRLTIVTDTAILMHSDVISADQ